MIQLVELWDLVLTFACKGQGFFFSFFFFKESSERQYVNYVVIKAFINIFMLALLSFQVLPII